MSDTHLDTKLSNRVTIRQYRQMEASRDRTGIATFIERRFDERYLDPLDTDRKHGFAMMAIACLMIEALQAFVDGKRDTRFWSRESFRRFFTGNQAFSALAATDFYDSVRCGILHQAETRNGWRIRRHGPLLDSSEKVLNATSFLDQLSKALKRYGEELRTSEWESEIWTNARARMDAICSNCAKRPARRTMGHG